MYKCNKQQTITFRNFGGRWENVAGDSGTLADLLTELGITIDDKLEFGRFRIWEKQMTILYRAYGGTITLTMTPWE